MQNYDLFDNNQVSNPYMVPAVEGLSLSTDAGHGSGNAIAANAEARVVSEVKAQIIISKQYPRNGMQSLQRILEECKRPMFAEAAVYSFPRGKETVSGASIRLAEVLARNWGNCTFGLEVLERKVSDYGVGYSAIRAFAWDLETNTYVSRQFELKHWRDTKAGGYALKDDRDIYELEANMGARRMRACILQMIPGDITATAVAACRLTTSSGLNDRMKDAKQRNEIVSKTIGYYQSIGVTQKDLEEYLNAIVKDWTADHMLKLKELKNSMDDGVLILGEVFPHLADTGKSDIITKEQIKELMELAKKTGKQGEISDQLKILGIPKFADVPASMYEEIKNSIMAMLPKAEEPKPEAPVAIEPEQIKLDK